jgi:hypothetical protein
MYRRPILCTLYGAVDFLNVLKKGFWGGGVLLVHIEIYYVPIGDGWEEVLVCNVLHYVPVLVSNHHLCRYIIYFTMEGQILCNYSTPPTHQQASMYTYTIVGGGGGALPTSPHPLNTCSHNTATRRSPHTSNTQQHTTIHNNTQQQYTTALGYIKLPMYQLFLWCLYLMVFASAISGPKKVSVFKAHPFQCPS